ASCRRENPLIGLQKYFTQNCLMQFRYARLPRLCRLWAAAVALLASPALWAAHGYALWGDLKYPAGFDHFDYVNPQAPQGGELRLVSNQRVSTFDKYNPFTVRGSAPAYLAALMFDSLLTPSLDETASAYGLLASDVAVADDGLSATF